MLLELTLKNWTSFRDSTSCSLLASEKETQHSDHKVFCPPLQTSILPITMLYGGNASGKSNLIHGLKFVRGLVVSGILIPGMLNSTISTNPFLLDKAYITKPSEFSIAFFQNDTVYEYKLEVSKVIHCEELFVCSADNDRLVFSRKDGKLQLGDGISDKDRDRLQSDFELIKDTQLLLNRAIFVGLQQREIVDAYDWFASLIFIDPDQPFSPFWGKPNKELDDLLYKLDTGISAIGYEPIKFELSDENKQIVKLLDGRKSAVLVSPNERLSIEQDEDLSFKVQRLFTRHLGPDGKLHKFQYSRESDGSKRAFDLAQAILALNEPGSKHTIFIDEIDRSLHPLMSLELIKMFLANRDVKSQSQLIVSCHNPLLLDQSLIRRDEVWLTDRDKTGISSLSSISDFAGLDDDSDIKDMYFLGKFGSLPSFF